MATSHCGLKSGQKNPSHGDRTMTNIATSALTNLTPPSEAYREATLSPVYRLSELTFGSLLAAYSLGFVGAIGAHSADLDTHGSLGVVLLSMQYASISITFAYLTTSFYLTYHAGILTMPQMPLYRLRVDFTLAIVQAMFFGFSMLRPWLFPILLGINFHLIGRRQTHEYEKLAEFLYNRICNPKRLEPENFRIGLEKFLREDFSELSSWGPVGPNILSGARKMMVMGAVIGIVCLGIEFVAPKLALPTFRGVTIAWIVQQALITSEIVLVTVKITRYGWDLLKRRAKFLLIPIKKPNNEEYGSTQVIKDHEQTLKHEPRLEIDQQFDSLQRKLAELCTG